MSGKQQPEGEKVKVIHEAPLAAKEATTTIHTTPETIAEQTHRATQLTHAAPPTATHPTVTEKIQHAAHALQETAMGAFEKTEDLVASGAHQLQETLQHSIEATEATLKSAASSAIHLGQETKSAAKEKTEQVKQTAEDASHEAKVGAIHAKYATGEALERAKLGAKEYTESAKESTKDITEGARQMMSDLSAKSKEEARELGREVKEKASAGKQRAETAAAEAAEGTKSMASGFVSGLQNVGHKLKETVSGLAPSSPPAANTLGIKSTVGFDTTSEQAAADDLGTTQASLDQELREHADEQGTRHLS